MARANNLGGSEWLRNSFSIWRGIQKDSDHKLHPATFPIALAEKIIDCYAADSEGLVLDPFAGSGSTLIAAARKDMPTLGFDINSDYKKIFENRLTASLNGTYNSYKSKYQYETRDARDLSRVVKPGSVEICVTSPPYWDILRSRRAADGKDSRPYSDDSRDIGNIAEYQDFIEVLGDVFAKVSDSIRVGGYCIVNVMDLRKKSTFYALHHDVANKVAGNSKLTLSDIVIWDRQAEYNSMRPLGYPYKFIINKVHEYLLIFRKEN